MKLFNYYLLCFVLITSTGCGQADEKKQNQTLNYIVQLPTEKSVNPPVIILLHGRGSNEQDLFELKDFFPKNYLIIAARAPYHLQEDKYEWYKMSNKDGHHTGKKEDLDNSRTLIIQLIEEVIKKYNADPKQVNLIGFSQGAMMSFYVGLSSPEKVKGIAPLSGMIIASLKPEIKNTEALKKLKIFIANGTTDDRISYSDGKEAYDYLLSIGLKPEFHSYAGMGHQISKDEINELINWLIK